MANTSSDSIFIRQSIHSDYCAVYSTAMFLSLQGRAVDRPAARMLFGARPSTWTGATHDQMREAISKYDTTISSRWIHTRPTTRRGFFRVTQARWTGLPLLATAFCLHRRYKIRDWHAFVIVSVTSDDVHILDPLSKVPAPNETWNAKVSRKGHNASSTIHVTGAAWEIDLLHPISFLDTTTDNPT